MATVWGLRADGNSRVHVGHNFHGQDPDDQCLTSLRTTNPRHDKSRIEDTNGGLLKDVYRWILSNAEFQQWQKDDHSRLLWIKGDAGKGKTMLICGIINELEKKPGRLLSYFFCQGTDSRTNTATAVLRGLIYLLVLQQRPLIRHVRDKLHGGQSIFDNTNGWYAICEIFRSIVGHELLNPAILVIDALDECQERLDQLLRVVIDTSSNSRIKWIISSRNLTQIERLLNIASINGKVVLSLEMNSAQVSDAVAIYISNKVSKLQTLRDDPEMRNMIEKKMRQKASGTFLWVALAFDELQTQDEDELEDSSGLLKILEQAPQGLSNLYRRMFQQIERLSPNKSHLCRTILATAFLAYRPLHLLELPILSGFKGNHTSSTTLERLVKMCGSFLTIENDTSTVNFVHQSAKDFLANDNTVFSTIFPCGKGIVHHDLFSRSLQTLKQMLHRNMYNLSYPGVLIDEIDKPNLDPLAPMRYSCLHWIDHFCDWSQARDVISCHEDREDVQLVQDFLENRYLYWLEALSLCRIVSPAIAATRKLEQVAASIIVSQWKELAYFAHDAHRFVLFHRQAIEMAPLQVYVSALIFSPTSSLVRKRYEPFEGPKWVTKKPAVQPEWDACLLSLTEVKTDAIESTAFAQDHKVVASGSVDGTIRLWDSYTGACLKAWMAHKWVVRSMAFAPGPSSTTSLASAGDDNLIKIWGTAVNGTPLQTLRGHKESVTKVAFVDCKTLLSLSRDQTVRSWDVTTGTLLRVTPVPSSRRAISPDGQCVTITRGSDRHLVLKPNDLGTSQTSVWGIERYIHDIVFFPDNTEFVSHNHETAEIWDLGTGPLLPAFRGLLDDVLCLAVSADGARVAFGLYGGDIEIRDSVKKLPLQILRGHMLGVSALSFSSGGKMLASGSIDGTVKIWDLEVGSSSRFLEYDLHNGLQVSPNGLWIISRGKDTARIWDTTASEPIHTIENISGWIKVAFSPDSLFMATASKSDPDTIVIIGTRTWTMQHSLSEPFKRVESLAFSPDGLWLASGCLDGSVTVWDARTWRIRFRLPSFKDWIELVVFSPQAGSTFLASGSHTGRINIWEVGASTILRSVKSSEVPNVMEFSPNCSWLASAGPKKVEIWDVGNGKLVKTVHGCFCKISWQPSGNILLLPEIHSESTQWRITSLKDREGSGCGSREFIPEVHLSRDGSWILVRGKRCVWLPCEYRRKASHYYRGSGIITSHSSICFASVGGRALFFQFKVSEIDSWRA